MANFVHVKTVYRKVNLQVANSMQAVEEWFRIRDYDGVGVSEVDYVKYYENGKHVADIAYNGVFILK